MSLFGLSINLFIDEIGKHPILWDHTSEDKTNRGKKNKAWLTVAGVFVEDFDQLSNSDRAEIVRKLQIKWRNLRDTYVRVKKNKITSKKGYVYQNNLAFLDSIYNFGKPDCPTEDDEIPSYSTSKQRAIKKREKAEEYSDNENRDEDDIYFDSQPKKRYLPPSTPPPPQREKPLKLKQSTKTIEFVSAQPSTRMRIDADDDVSFFESLIPAVKEFDMDQKLGFRTEVLSLITKIRTQAQDLYNPFKQGEGEDEEGFE